MLLVSLHDVKADTWSNPHITQNALTAKREFAALVSDKSTLVGKNPADFDLWSVGEWSVDFNRDSGKYVAKLSALPAFEHIANGADFEVHQ